MRKLRSGLPPGPTPSCRVALRLPQGVAVVYYGVRLGAGLAVVAAQYVLLRWRGWRLRALVVGTVGAAGLLVALASHRLAPASSRGPATGAGGGRRLAGPPERPHSEAVTRVAILDDYQGVALRLADWGRLPAGADVVVFRDHAADEAAVAARLADFDVVVAMRERTPFPRTLIERLRRLRLLVTTGMRNASIDLRAAADHGVVVCGTGGLPYPTAELTWALILALVRHVPREDRATRDGRWQETLGTGLNGKTLGVLGLGQLGSRVARVGRAFEMDVLGWSQNLTAERAAAVGATLAGSRDELLAGADVVTIHLVLSDRTRGLLGARELALMRRSAYLVNTSRGPIVDERALIDALRAGAIAGAGLDVYDEEPLPLDHPLRRLPNTVITPHLGYVTEDTYRIFYAQALEDVGAFLAGTPIRVLTP